LIIFVVGSARSGTTLIAQILGRHSQVFAFGELHFFEELWVPRDRGRILRAGQDLELASRLIKNQKVGPYSVGKPEAFCQQATEFLRPLPPGIDAIRLYAAFLRYYTRANHRQIPLTHTPRDLYYVREILDQFEEARVIWMVRDPRAVLCSQKLRWRRPLWRKESPSRLAALRAWLNYHPITYSLILRSALRAASRYVDHPAVRRVVFERLIENPSGEIGELLQWLGLGHEGEMLQVPRTGSSHHPDRAAEIGIDPEALARWRGSCLTPTEISICQRLAGREMQDAGYRIEPAEVNAIHLAFHVTTWLPRTAAAFLLHLRRTRSPWLAIRRRLASHVVAGQ
jgi:hypothetical protein